MFVVLESVDNFSFFCMKVIDFDALLAVVYFSFTVLQEMSEMRVRNYVNRVRLKKTTSDWMVSSHHLVLISEKCVEIY